MPVAGAAHADSNKDGNCVSLWNYALKLKLEKETLVSCDTAFTARAIVQLYINIQARYLNNSDPYDKNPLNFEDVLTTTRLEIFFLTKSVFFFTPQL